MEDHSLLLLCLAKKRDSALRPTNFQPFFKMYGKDGRDSLAASCTPIDLKPIINHVTCKSIRVRFDLPGKRPGSSDMPLSVEDAVKTIPGFAEEMRENSKKAEQEFIQELETSKQQLRGGFGNSDRVRSGSLASPKPPAGGEPEERGDEQNTTESRGHV